jgi:hypothetical protein
MKISRLGSTESTLLMLFWFKYISNNELPEIIVNHIKYLNNMLLVWLFVTSGFYDKKLNYDFYNINLKEYDLSTIQNSNISITNFYDDNAPYLSNLKEIKFFENYDDTVLVNYYIKVLEALKDSDILYLTIHEENNLLNGYIKEFIYFLEPKTYNYITEKIFFDFIRNKNVLIISSFSELFETQYKSGNLKIIYPDFPDILSLSFLQTPYTFFNDGPHKNIFETCDILFEKIMDLKNNFDCVIISFGCYSNLLANKINKKLYKDTMTIGDQLQLFFGIINKRNKEKGIKVENEEYYIKEIPDYYKPFMFEKIENGCYW